MGTYFDTILNDTYDPVYTAVPDEMIPMVKAIPDEHTKDLWIYIGLHNKIVSVWEYLNMYN